MAEPLDRRGEGYEALWDHFGLSYASFLVLSRAVMHEMPDEWQGRMASLLAEFSEAFPGVPLDDFSVSGRKGNRFTEIPLAMRQYRRPLRDEINRYREHPHD